MVLRKKLFSSIEEKSKTSSNLRVAICADCGYKLETAGTLDKIYCPNCGGKRFDLSLFSTKGDLDGRPAEDKKRVSVFDNYETPYEKELKDKSGETLSKEDFEKTFSDKSEDMLEKGFAVASEGGITISDKAYGIEKLFSRLTITLTKTLELDPKVMNRDKGDLLDELAVDHKVPEEGIMILRRAHNVPEDRTYSINKLSEKDQWVEDSSIIPDLIEEYKGKRFGLGQFVKLLRGRYPDAPEDIIDILSDRGAISINGKSILINKKINLKK